jgi:acyl-CoA synthetase (AMP-forming)/AMP-acid ligase II
VTASASEPESLAAIASRRIRRDPATPFLLTMSEDEPYDLATRDYGEIGARAAALAAALVEAGVAPGQRVGCYLSNTPSWVVASLGVWWAGASMAAVGTLVPAPEATVLFGLAEVGIVVAESDAPDLSADFTVLTVDKEGRLPGGATPAVAAPVPDFPEPDPAGLAAVFFTSGTTGRSKGITYTHADFVTAAKRIAGGYARNVEYRPDPAPAHLAPGVVFNPFGHTAGFVRLAFRMWIGRPVLLVPKFTVRAARGYLARFKPDSLQLTPTMIHMLATAEEDLQTESLRYVTSGTAPLSVATRDRFEQRFGVPVLDAYGMTEIGTVAQERLEDVLAGRRGPGAVGRPATGVEIRIRPLDDDRPEGEGEILVRTAQTMPTEFVGGQRVPVDADGWFATGDVGRMTDGILYITGRSQEKIIVGGFNVYPAEVEDVARRSPLVADAVVVGLPDERRGEYPAIGVVWAGEADPAGLLAGLRADLAPYKIPREVFALDAVPLTPRDKVDRRRARELARAALGVLAADG